MSHVSTYGKIANTPQALTALAAAAEAMGGTLTPSDTYRWYGVHVGDYPLPEGFTKADMGKCKYKISFPDCGYDIGVLPHPLRPDELVVIFDFWTGGKGLVAKVGKQAEKLLQMYGVHAAMQWAQSKGKAAHVTQLPNGTYQIEVQ